MANFCTQCGTAVQAAAKFCNNCGTKLIDNDHPTASPPIFGSRKSERGYCNGDNPIIHPGPYFTDWRDYWLFLAYLPL